jgi:hypothetical protein
MSDSWFPAASHTWWAGHVRNQTGQEHYRGVCAFKMNVQQGKGSVLHIEANLQTLFLRVIVVFN